METVLSCFVNNFKESLSDSVNSLFKAVLALNTFYCVRSQVSVGNLTVNYSYGKFEKLTLRA